MKLKKTLRLARTERFKKSVLDLDQRTQRKFKKQLKLLLSDPRNPSLRVKKVKGTRAIFEARVNDSYRFTFEFGGESDIILRVVGHHNATLKKP